jgi:ketosteroid isomerase-like protein
MADAKVELVRRTCAVWSSGDLDATLELIHPDARWEPSGKFIGSGETYRGHAGVQKFWAIFREAWTDISLEPVEFTAIDETRLLTRTRFRGMGRASGLETETELFVVWTIEDGKVSGYQSFAERELALDAAGVSTDGG